jgi:SAM-dependent methyltransferase
MYLPTKIRNVVRGLKQKWGSFGMKRRLWDKEYGGGRWDHCEHTPGSAVYSYVENYCMNGSILDLGCGSGNTGNELDICKYHDYTGVDISEVAIQNAAARSQRNGRREKNRYIQSDISSCVPKQKHDVILFRESIYYIPRSKIRGLLKRYSHYLTDKGVFVVHVSKSGTRKWRPIFEIIERNHMVMEKALSVESGDFVVVFR